MVDDETGNAITVSCTLQLTTGGEMADDRYRRGPQDRRRINVHEDYEVRYWCEKFGCTNAELADAVKQVGVMAADVEKHPKNKKR
ncbi:DUF3606 domain-containing protein [Bradyrhizobium diazoefficiens]|uniref:DUF3606 domain-containing protein n=1 Tax=Bradyrhizobium diazoefficiens TaxID=1355477 RepID=UPI003834A1E7